MLSPRSIRTPSGSTIVSKPAYPNQHPPRKGAKSASAVLRIRKLSNLHFVWLMSKRHLPIGLRLPSASLRTQTIGPTQPLGGTWIGYHPARTRPPKMRCGTWATSADLIPQHARCWQESGSTPGLRLDQAPFFFVSSSFTFPFEFPPCPHCVLSPGLSTHPPSVSFFFCTCPKLPGVSDDC